MKRISVPVSWLAILILVAMLAWITAALLLMPPRRWHEPITELNRTQVRALLGNPDADASVKGWDGWDQPAVVGAWVLKVYYTEEGRVITVQKYFDWGFGYLSWERDYRKLLPKSNPRKAQ